MKALMKAFGILSVLSVFLWANPIINGAGASFPANAYMTWMKSYERASGVKINYQSIGSGGGVKQIKSKLIDFGGTDEALDSKDLAKNGLIQFPALSGAIVLAYNIEGVKDGELRLSNEAISGIFLGKITQWNDNKILEDNPNLKLPASPITLIHRSDGSGTTYNFTLFLSEISKEWADKIGYGKAISWVKGIGAKGNEGVTHLVKQTKNSIGYVELSYKEQMGLSAAQIQNSQGKWVIANGQSIQNASKNASWDLKKDFQAHLINQKGDNTYPLVSASFILIPKKSKNTASVIKFFDYVFKNGDEEALRMGLNPLPENTKMLIRNYWKEKGVEIK